MNKLKIQEKTTFQFAFIENAERVATSLARGGYFVKMTGQEPAIMVHVYTDREI